MDTDQILIEAAHILEAVKDSEGREWDVMLIQAGLSKNGKYYPPETLKKAAHLFEGVFCYADHATEEEDRVRPERSVRDKVGVFRGVKFGQFQVGDQLVEGLGGRFKVMDRQVRETLLEAQRMDEPEFLGFSIDAFGPVTKKLHEGRMVGWVKDITKVRSVDMVTDPAAGGRVMRLVASNAPGKEHEIMETEEITRLATEATATALREALPGLVTSLQEALKPTVAAPVVDDETKAAVAELREGNRLRAQESVIDAALREATGLSEVGKARIRVQLVDTSKRRDLDPEEVGAALREALDYEAALNPSLARSHGGSASVGQTQKDKVHLALQGWFAGEPVEGIPPLRSLKEGYCLVEGVDPFEWDAMEFQESFAVPYQGERTHKRLKESLTTASWGQIFADVMYLRMITEYAQAQEQLQWRLIVSDIVSVDDFRTYHFARVGGYADLSSVAEGATYPTLTTPTDEETTFSVAKYGGLDDWSLEAALGDKVNKVRQLPQKMAMAAARGLYKTVMGMATTTNAVTGYDSVALYAAGHSNTGTTALSVAGLDAVSVAMRDQTPYNTSAEVLGSRNAPKYVIVPNELEARAQRIVNPSAGYTFALSSSPDADLSMDPARWADKGIVPLVYDYLTDATDWFVVADPKKVPTIVMGFLNGNQNPELFLQDQPTVGSNFTSDKTTAKVRLIYGGTVLEHRSFYRQVV